MSKSKNVKLRGTFKWAKVFEENRDMEGFDGAYKDCDGAYTIDVGLSAEEYQKLKEAGSQKEAREKDGLFWVKFTRKHTHPKIPDLGGPPGVFTGQGEAWDYDVDGIIPNDSSGTVLVNVYKAGRVTGTRLQKIQVLEKAEYEGDGFIERPKVSPRMEELEDELIEDEGVGF